MPTAPENSISSSDPYLTLATLNDVSMMICEGPDGRRDALKQGYREYVNLMDDEGQLPLGFVIRGEADGQTITIEGTRPDDEGNLVPDPDEVIYVCWVQRNAEGDIIGEPVDVSDDEPERWLQQAWLRAKSIARHPHTLSRLADMAEEDDD